jgi:hypothetical protein
MSLRPLPDLTNADAMVKLGALSALRSARADALHQLRDACVRLQNSSSIDSIEIANCEEALQRLKDIEALHASIA